jgi:ribosome biogenesis protein
LDGSLRIHRVRLDSNLPISNDPLETVVVNCLGHSGSVDCIAVNPSQTLCVSGSWDHTLRLWSVTSPNSPNDEHDLTHQQSKNNHTNLPEETRRHMDDPASMKSTPTTVISRSPIASMTAHSQPVTCVVYPSADTIYSGGHDQCIRVWDASMASLTRTLTCDRAILDLSSWDTMIASGHSDGIIRIWDARVSEGPMVRSTLTGHLGWVSSLMWLPLLDKSFSVPLLLSGSYDKTIRLWDLRAATTPLYTLKAHEDKVLDVSGIVNPDQPSQLLLLSGGNDNMLRIFSMSQSVLHNVMTFSSS